MAYSRITGTGGYLPERALTNRDLESIVDTSDEWIVSHTGIETRYLAADDQFASDLGVHACRRAMADAGVTADDVDLVIVATTTQDMVFPATASLIQEKLGITRGAAFDVQAVCTGFVYALAIADKFVASGQHRCALVVGSEVFSRILDWNDRTTCILFGDGAGAVVLETASSPGIVSSHLHSDGRLSGILRAPGGLDRGTVYGNPRMEMDGRAVFRTAVRVLGEVARETLEHNGLAPDDIDWVVPHQANARILEAVADEIGIERERVVITIGHQGNTSAASVPLALATASADGRLCRDQRVLLLGMGGGMTWGSVLLRW